MKLSVIIPTLNESDYLAAAIQRAQDNAYFKVSLEFIVVDSGSMDGTQALAKSLGAVVINSSGNGLGKSNVLNAGAASASGDVYVFLDADTLLPGGYDLFIQRALNDPNVVGGAFGFSLDGKGFGLRIIELINRVRYRVRQRYYGDQAVFVRAEAFKRVGGYPEMLLLESAHLCKKLRGIGRLELVKRPVITSSRRFINGGVYRVLLSDIKIWLLDALGFSVDKFAYSYWNENNIRGGNSAES